MRVFLFVSFLTTITFQSIAQNPIGTNAYERKVLKMINSLPEVIKENEYRKKERYKFFLKAFIQNVPTKKDNYYSVSVSEDLGFQLRTYQWFLVTPKTWHIRYRDIPNDTVISLYAWRKQSAAAKKLYQQHHRK